MATIPLPTLPVASKTEAAKILAAFGGEDDYLAWLTSALHDELERRAVRAADETANAAKRDAIEAAMGDAPSITAAVEAQRVAVASEPVELVAEPVEAVTVETIERG